MSDAPKKPKLVLKQPGRETRIGLTTVAKKPAAAKKASAKKVPIAKKHG